MLGLITWGNAYKSIVNPRTNYGKFNIRFQGPKIWNDIDYDINNFLIFFSE